MGINPASLRDGTAQEEKKALGNCHIGFGIARPFPGSWMAKHKTLIHSDMVVRETRVYLDGKLILDRGSSVRLTRMNISSDTHVRALGA